MTDTLIEVEVPSQFVALCGQWAGSETCRLRAIDSTGGLTMGSIRPYNSDEGRMMTDQEWHYSLFSDLSCDIAYYRRMAEKAGMKRDARRLAEFEEWADRQCEMLAREYGLDR